MAVRVDAQTPAGAPRFRGLRPLRVSARWTGYQRRLVLVDAAIIAAATVLAYALRFDTDLRSVAQAHPVDQVVMTALVPTAWMLALTMFRTYERRFLGLGSEEFGRVLRAAMCCVAAIGTVSWALKLDIARGFVILALPSATVATLAARYAQRHWLHWRRRQGEHTQSVLLAGHRAGVESMVRTMNQDSYHGMRVAGLCLPGGHAGHAAVAGVPVVGDLHDVATVAVERGLDAVAVLPTPELDGAGLRRLGWALEASHTELYVAPAITEVVGPRVAIRPVVGMPLLHVERPELTGGRRVAKGVVEWLVAAVGVFVLLPVLLAIAVAVRLDSPGPVFFRQARVGKDGTTFRMWKFRSMVIDAEGRLAQLRARAERERAAGGAGNDVLFKLKHDPRVTAVGRVLRRTSLDELPQLFNVLAGQMALVGPRPPLAAEVELYGDDARRRLLVKPGLTGLWQISGRSDLDWDESVRLDLRYVENWSFAFDLMILWKTLGAVVRSRGAY